jgi:hypothetical protein
MFAREFEGARHSHAYSQLCRAHPHAIDERTDIAVHTHWHQAHTADVGFIGAHGEWRRTAGRRSESESAAERARSECVARGVGDRSVVDERALRRSASL